METKFTGRLLLDRSSSSSASVLSLFPLLLLYFKQSNHCFFKKLTHTTAVTNQRSIDSICDDTKTLVDWYQNKLKKLSENFKTIIDGIRELRKKKVLTSLSIR